MSFTRTYFSLHSFRLWLSVVFAVMISTVWGQVAGIVSPQPAQGRDLQVIDVSWDLAEEHHWKEIAADRLEIMGVRVDIFSEKLTSVHSPLQFNLPNHTGLVELLLENVIIAPGENLILVDEVSGKEVFRISSSVKSVMTPAFDPRTCQLSWTTMLEGRYASRFTISTMYVYFDTGRDPRDIGFNTALACHPNAACKTDSVSGLISSSAVRMRLVMEEGIGWCTGSLINNTNEDKTPYILTAYHCRFNFTPRFDQWRFDFQYTSDSCHTPSNEPFFYSIFGCSLTSSWQSSDFMLVRLSEDIPLSLETTFAGWNRDDLAIPSSTVLVHHPNADIRKFSTCSNASVIHPNQIGWSEGYTTPANHHFRFKFTEGGHQPGSSGGPVYNESKLLIGQLHGGQSGCEAENTAFVGRLSKSWDGGGAPDTRLKDWLDPANTGETAIAHLPNVGSADIVDLHGTVRDAQGVPVPNTTIEVSGDIETTITTDASGAFSLNGINRLAEYTLTPQRDINPKNGLNVFDPLAIQKHLLGVDTFDFEWQHTAADATSNGEVSAGDMVLIMRLLLGRIQAFPSSPSWKFDPPSMYFKNLPAGLQAPLEFMAIKVGDVNGTADPSQ